MKETTVIFVRHCEADNTYRYDRTRPLTKRGMKSVEDVAGVLLKYPIDALYSSPYKRTLDTLSGYARKTEKEIHVFEGLRERELGFWIEDMEDFAKFMKRQWEDFTYTVKGTETLGDVQKRNITALKRIISKHEGGVVAVATHGCALSTILNYYDSNLGYENFMRIIDVLPYIIKLTFSGSQCTGMEEITDTAQKY